VSKYAYRWLRAVYRAYGNRPDLYGHQMNHYDNWMDLYSHQTDLYSHKIDLYGNRTDVAGVSLQSDGLILLSSRRKGPLAGPKNDTVFMYKCFGSWGFAPKPRHWRRFQVHVQSEGTIYSYHCPVHIAQTAGLISSHLILSHLI